MLKRRLIPKLQLKTKTFGKIKRLVLVTTYQFENEIEVGDPISQAKIYQAQMADELIFIDLDAVNGLRPEFVEMLNRAAEQVFMPFTVGGGVKTIEDFRILLSNGADKISINTAAFYAPDLVNQAAKYFGSQCVVVSIDYVCKDGKSYVCTQGPKKLTHLSPIDWALEVEARGAGEILLTSIDRDGTCKGLDLEILKSISDRVSIPVIAAGGCGLASHFIEGFNSNASGVAAGTFFCFKDQNPMQTRAHIKNANIEIRLQQ